MVSSRGPRGENSQKKKKESALAAAHEESFARLMKRLDANEGPPAAGRTSGDEEKPQNEEQAATKVMETSSAGPSHPHKEQRKQGRERAASKDAKASYALPPGQTEPSQGSQVTTTTYGDTIDEASSSQVPSAVPPGQTEPIEDSHVPAMTLEDKQRIDWKGKGRASQPTEEEYEILRSECEELKRAKEALERENEKKKELLASAEFQLYEKEDQVTGAENQKKKLTNAQRQVLRLKDLEITNLTQALKEERDTRAKDADFNRNAKSIKQSLESRLSNKERSIAKLETENYDLKSELDKAKRQILNFGVLHSSLQQHNNELEPRVLDREKDLHELREATKTLLEADLADRQDAAATAAKFKATKHDGKEWRRSHKPQRRHSHDGHVVTKSLEQEIREIEASSYTDHEAQTDFISEIVTLPAKQDLHIKIWPQYDLSPVVYTKVQAAKKPANDTLETIQAQVNGATKTQKGRTSLGVSHFLFLMATILLLSFAVFALYHGLQARAERTMWRNANDLSARALIYYREAAGKGHRVPWMTPTAVKGLQTGYRGGRFQSRWAEW